MNTLRDDEKNLRKAKTIAKILVIGCFCFFTVLVFRTPKTEPVGEKNLQIIQLNFEQFVEPVPVNNHIEPVDEKKLIVEESDFKVTAEPEPIIPPEPVREPEVKPVEPPVFEKPPEDPPKIKPIKRPKKSDRAVKKKAEEPKGKEPIKVPEVTVT